MFLIRLLQWRFKNRFIPLTDSEMIASEFQKKLRVLPIPHTIQGGQAEEQIICWWPGRPRQEKGLADIQRLAKIQDRRAIAMALSQEAGIACQYQLPSTLTVEEYHHWLERSRVILLPYAPDVYRSGTSGIFVEAIVAGKMPLVKEGSWLANELKRFDLSELIVNWEDPLFFSHLHRKLESEIIKVKLQKMQETYAAYHSLDYYTQKLKELLKYSQIDCN